MKPIYAILSALYIGVTFISCAGTDSSAKKKGEEAPNLFKAGTPVADSLFSRMPELAHSVFQKTLDSVPGEYYYHVTDDRIDTLFKKEGGQYKPIVSIDYDFLIGQDSYDLEIGSHKYFVMDNTLKGEEEFPKWSKAYWDNGNLKVLATGILYKNDQGNTALDSGHLDLYFENGKIQEQSDWKKKQIVAGKVWNENGILIYECDFPKYSKSYWDNGNPKEILVGILYRDDQGYFLVDSGRSEIYFENGKIHQQNDWKGKQHVAYKEWNENGVLVKDIDFSTYYKEYWDNGKRKGLITGLLYRDDQGVVAADSGVSESYFENEKMFQQNVWKNKQIIAQKEWNENGVLVKDTEFPKYTKEYWDNGKPRQIFTGLLHRENNLCLFKPDSGHAEIYYENGKTKELVDWKDKQVVAGKTWNENGVLTKDLFFPKYLKEYWANGNPKTILTGLLYRDDQGLIKVDSGRSEEYFENGKSKRTSDWKNKQYVAQKEWNEKGKMTKDVDFPKFAKAYWDNGNPKTIMTGLLYWDVQGVVQVDSGHMETYFENGKIQKTTDWRNKQYIKQKEWTEKGLLLTELDFPKSVKEYWDNGKLKQKATGVIYRDNKDDQNSFAVDSGRAETYFRNGKINQQNDWKNKQPVASKQWNENGILVKELDFPRFTKEYWDNGKPKAILTGLLYRDNYGGLHLDSGHSEIYFENGKIREQNDWKNKQPVASKQWNENGMMIYELDFPKYFKEYWDNGKLKGIMTGLLYRDDQSFHLDSGHSETYFENGKIREKNDWKNKQLVASKVWNESETLIKDFGFPKYVKEYWDNGKLKVIATGTLYWGDHGNTALDSGHSETYFENGKIREKNDWKNKQLVASKVWNESGTLIKDIGFPKYYKEYWDNGMPKTILTGVLYRDNQGVIRADSGHSEIYFKNGKISEQNDWKSKQLVASKVWNESGTLIKDIGFPKYYKEYWDNGMPKTILTGVLYRDNQGVIRADSGHSEIYFENGRINLQVNAKDSQNFARKEWNENGVLVKDLAFPKYIKVYWDNGMPKTIATGVLYRDNQGNFWVDSGHSEIYFENGKIKEQNDWKDKQIAVNKTWNENGVLILDINFPKYVKEYWDNGKPKAIMTGVLYRDNQGFHLDSGHSETYFENGKINQQNDWKNKQLVANKTWNENGVLTRDFISSKYAKEYWDNGKPKAIMTGLFYWNKDNIQIDSGHVEAYYENGKNNVQFDFKDKQLVSAKMWSENGTLTMDANIPAGYLKAFSENGTIIFEVTGFKGNIGFDGNIDFNGLNTRDFSIESGHLSTYYDNGKPMGQAQYKEKNLISQKIWYENGAIKQEGDVTKGAHKVYFPNGNLSMEVSGKFHYDENRNVILESGSQKWWNENGTLTAEILFPKYAKLYSDSGNLDFEIEGTLYYDDQGEIQVQDGFKKEYYENKKLALHKVYKGKKLVSKTVWNESGVITVLAELPNRYREFYDDGKLKTEVTGTIIEEDDSFKIKDGTYKEYFNGTVTYTATYEDFQKISEK